MHGSRGMKEEVDDGEKEEEEEKRLKRERQIFYS